MPGKKEYSTEEVAAMRRALAETGSKAEAARRCGVPLSTLKEHTKDMNGTRGGKNLAPRAADAPIDGDGEAPQQRRWEEDGDAAVLHFTTDKLIQTLEQAIEHSGLDTKTWYVKSWTCGGWTTPVKLRQGQDGNGRYKADRGFVKQNWTIRLNVHRILPRSFLEASEAIYARLADHAPSYKPVARPRPKVPYLMEVDLFDVHIGKLAWERESRQNYDLKIAERVFAEAVEDILSEAVGREIERILIPIGNDFFNIDGIGNATTNGTPQDTDGRYPKIIEVGTAGFISAIERARQIAPVRLIYLPGNHDRIASLHLTRELAAWFRNCPDVEVDHSPVPRKFESYGRHYIGFTHGDEERVGVLPALLATEDPAAWAAADFREWHCGHRHRKGQTESTPIRTQDGVKVRHLHALSAIEAWHYRKGYYGGKRAAEAFLFARDSGNCANIEVALREYATPARARRPR